MRLRKQAKPDSEEGRPLGSNQVFSYRSYRSGSARNTGRRQGASDSQNQKTSGGVKSVVKKVLPVLIFIIIFTTLLSTVVLGGNPRVRVIQTDGGIQRTDSNAYQNGISGIWAADINNWTKLTVNAEKTSQSITALFPEIASAQIELPLLGRRPVIVVTTSAAVATLSNQTGIFFVSHEGKLIGEVGAEFNYSGAEPLIEIIDNSGLDAKTGQYVLNEDQVTVLRAIYLGMQQSGLKIDQIILPAIANQVDIRLDDEPYYIKYSLLEDPRQGVGALLTARDIFNETGTPTEYVDVRIPEKVFYK